MVAHVVLFEPKPDVTAHDRDEFLAVLSRACAQIPAVRRAQVGSRLSGGAGYDAVDAPRYSYVAVIEFEDRSGLEAYLAHPAHRQLGALFWKHCERTLIVDAEMELLPR